LLLITDQFGMTLRRIEHLGVGDAVIIGIVQALALIPGTSRSGICMTMARMMGMERQEAARFAMLLGIPAIAGAGTLKGFELWQMGDAQMTADAFVAGGFSMVMALIAIALMMAWLRRATFTIFAVYRLLLGGFLLAVAYGFA
jgi:undecaprenyl-diphosphatase